MTIAELRATLDKLMRSGTLADRVAKSIEFRSKRLVTAALHVGQWGGAQAVTPLRSLRYRRLQEELFAGAYRRSKALADEVAQRSRVTIPDDRGAATASVTYLPEGLAAVTRAQEILESLKSQHHLEEFSISKPYLIPLRIPGADLALESPFVRLALHPELLGPIAGYLGVLPVLREIGLFYSPNLEAEGTLASNTDGYDSRFAHIDEPADRHMRVLLNVSNVTEDSGPLHFLPAKDSDRITEYVGRDVFQNRLSDAELEEIAQKALGAPPVFEKAVGPPGTLWFVDSCRCWHFGSRKGNQPRLVLGFWFVHPFAANLLPHPLQRFNRALLGFPKLSHLALETKDPIARAVLGSGTNGHRSA